MDTEEHEEPILLRVLRVGLVAYVAMLLLLAVFQRQLLYFPTHYPEGVALQQAGREKLEPWRDANGALIGWIARNKEAKGRLLVFHGNAGSALDRGYYRDIFGYFKGGASWEIALFEYPGYGSRQGAPGEESFTKAAREALQELKRESNRPVIVLGESVGSGVACSLAAEGQVQGLLLVTPFTSLTDTAAHHYPLFPVRMLLRDRFDNLTAMQGYRGRLAVVLAGRDEVVPKELGQALFDSYAGPKKIWIAPQAVHNTAIHEIPLRDWEAIAGFLLSSGE